MECKAQLDGPKAGLMRQAMLRRLAKASVHAEKFSKFAAARADARSRPLSLKSTHSYRFLVLASMIFCFECLHPDHRVAYSFKCSVLSDAQTFLHGACYIRSLHRLLRTLDFNKRD